MENRYSSKLEEIGVPLSNCGLLDNVGKEEKEEEEKKKKKKKKKKTWEGDCMLQYKNNLVPPAFTLQLRTHTSYRES